MMIAEIYQFHWFWSTSGKWYGFWSGFGSCLTEFAIVGALWKKFNCHSKGCWRVGLHHVDGTPYITCHRHHPELGGNKHSTADDIKVAHRRAQLR